jgi:ABC-2 type transport system permease protein
MNSFFIAANMLKRVVSRKKGWIYYFLLPMLFISIAISVLGQQNGENLKVGVVNLDQGDFSTYLLNYLTALPNTKVQLMNSESELKEKVSHHTIHAGLVIPMDYTDHLIEDKSSKLQLLEFVKSGITHSLSVRIEAQTTLWTRSIEQIKALSSEKAIILEKMKQLEQEHTKLSQAPLVDNHLNPVSGLNTTIGILLMFMMILTNSTVAIISEDRRQRTLSRIFAAPVTNLEIMLGYLMGSLSVGTLQISVIVLFTRYGLGYNFGISIFHLLLILELFLMVCIGISSVVAYSSNNKNYKGGIESLILIPSCMIGGCFWPMELMPDTLQKLGNFVPQKWVIDAIMKLASGQILIDIRLNLGILALFAVVLITFGYGLLKPVENNIIQ